VALSRQECCPCLQAKNVALLVDNPEPSRMLLSLSLGPQVQLQEEPEVPHTVRVGRGAVLVHVYVCVSVLS